MIDIDFMKSIATSNIGYWNYMWKIKNAVSLILQKERDDKIIGSSLDAELDLYADEKNAMILNRLGDECRFFFIVSRADLHLESARPDTAKETIIPGLWVSVIASSHPKCARCWNHGPEIGLDKNHPTICYRCIDNISETGTGEVRKYV